MRGLTVRVPPTIADCPLLPQPDSTMVVEQIAPDQEIHTKVSTMWTQEDALKVARDSDAVMTALPMFHATVAAHRARAPPSTT